MKPLIIAPALLALAATPALAGTSSLTTSTTEISTVYANHHGEHKEKKDIVATAEAAGFDTLLAAAKAAGLVEALQSDGPLTVFAPTDEAFAALGQDTIDMLLMPENKDKLAAVLKYHVVAGKVTSADIAGKELEAETLNGESLDIDATDGVMIDGASVVKADVMASNGVIHVIDKVLMP